MNTIIWIDAALHALTLIAAIRVIMLFDKDRLTVKERVHRFEERLQRCERLQHDHLDHEVAEDDPTKPVTLHLVAKDEGKSA